MTPSAQNHLARNHAYAYLYSILGEYSVTTRLTYEFCFTACNRTYYGEVGSTYHISLSSETIAAALGLNHPQQVDSQSSNSGHGGPAQFVCHLTFFAAGDNFGDLVQVSRHYFYTNFFIKYFWLNSVTLQKVKG